MIAYGISSFLNYPCMKSLGPSILQMARFHSFLWLSTIPLYTCIISSYPCICPYTLHCFHVLAIVNSASVKIGYMYLSTGRCLGTGLLDYMAALICFLRTPSCSPGWLHSRTSPAVCVTHLWAHNVLCIFSHSVILVSP